MIISLNWLKKYTDIDMPVKELVTLIGARLVEIEEVINLGAKYTDVIVAKVIEVSQLEGSDHLSVTKIDDGGKSLNVDRDENGFVQVVCGAPNIAIGQLVVWLPPESTVPATFGSETPFILGKRELRGVISNGMIASAKELDLFDEHDGILVLDKELQPGESFAKEYELDDYLLDIENKSLTHRPDTFGIIGFAREVAAIAGKPFKTPEWLINIKPDFTSVQVNDVELNVTIDNPELSSRYLAIVMSGADGSKKSPLQFQTYLSRVGIRPISAVVDVTNYLMMLTGQPLHAFDYDKLVNVSGGKADIHVRAGLEKEILELLDGRVIELTPDDIVIAAGNTAIGLAGAMGGANTEIDENTKNIIIESATFNLYNLRATQMRHGIFSEAITRFTKGQPAGLAAPVLFDAVRLMIEWSGAKCVSNLIESYPVPHEKITIDFGVDSINSILGSGFYDNEMMDTLQNVEFEITQTNPKQFKVTVPYWRADIHIVEDLAEEIGRLRGFDNITPTLPKRDFSAIRISDFDNFRDTIRKTLVRAGGDEVLTYSFVHGDIIYKAGQDINNSYKVVNSLSPDLQYYRQSLTPNLIDLIHPNIKQGYDEFALFELNKTQSKQDGLDEENVPIESDMLALVVANKDKQSGAPYYKAKRIIDYLLDEVGAAVIYEPMNREPNNPVTLPFEPLHSAKVISKTDGLLIGYVGQYKKSVARGFKLPEYTAGFEINIRALLKATHGLGKDYQPLSRFPSAERDICFQVLSDVVYSRIIAAANIALGSIGLEAQITPIDIYQPVNGKTKNITIRVRLTSHDYTLNSEEVTSVIESVSNSVISETNATVI